MQPSDYPLIGLPKMGWNRNKPQLSPMLFVSLVWHTDGSAWVIDCQYILSLCIYYKAKYLWFQQRQADKQSTICCPVRMLQPAMEFVCIVYNTQDACIISDLRPRPSRHFMTNLADRSTTLVDGFKTTRRTYGGCMARMAGRCSYPFISTHFCIYCFGFIFRFKFLIFLRKSCSYQLASPSESLYDSRLLYIYIAFII